MTITCKKVDKRIVIQMGTTDGDLEVCHKTALQQDRCYLLYTDLLSQYKDCDKCDKKAPTEEYVAKIMHMLG